LTITPEAAAVQIHNYLAVHATAYDTNGTPVSAKISWRSSDAHIATVGDTGLVHGVGLGVVTIFASANGVNDSAVVAVVDTAVASPPPDSGTVPPDSSRRPPPPPDSGSVPPDTTHRPPPPPPDSVPPDTVPPKDTLTSR
ncbi:MAG TPA: Ig-like domain-containing protein, partial [Gemmatimonadaceae bacterium]|nr:Ig-like domain-containing protein [Gemmatimonadaceae bacterium]